MIDYLAELYVKVLILLSCLGWMALVFWGAIYVAEKILRLVYQDAPKQLYTSDGPHPFELQPCIDCSGLHMLDADGRCDLCVSIERASVAHYGFATRPGEAWADPIYVSGSGAHDYDPLDFEDHDQHDHEDLVADGRVIKRICLP